MSTTRRPWHIALPLLAILVLFAIWSAYWIFALNTARTTFETHRAQFAQRGIVLTCATESWGGYPFRFEYDCQSPTLNSQAYGLFKTSRILAIAQAYQPWHILFLLDGPTSLRPSDANPIAARHGRTMASLSLKDPDQPVLTVEIPDLQIPNVITAKSLLVSLRNGVAGSLDIALDANAPTITVPHKPILVLDRAALDGTLSRGPTLSIHASSLTKRTLQAAATGTLTLDDAHQPTGEIKAETNDPKLLLDTAAPYLNMQDQDKQQATIMLQLLGSKATLTARQGGLYLGPISLMKLPRLY